MWGHIVARCRQAGFALVEFQRRELPGQWIIMIIATTVVSVWVFTKPIVFTQDTFTYMEHARELQLGRSSDPNYPRLPVFPAILWASKVTDLKHSVSPLIFFHSVLAIAACGLFYAAARRVEPRGAFVVSLVFIASLLPFMHVKHIMTEQSFLFETIFALYGLVWYLTARTTREARKAIAVLGAGVALMMLTRPQGSYVLPVLFGIVAVLVWRRALTALIGAVLVVATVWAVQTADKIRIGSQNFAGSFESSHTTGAMLLFSLYLDGIRANIHISAENGPRSTELEALLLDELAKPDTLARRSGYLSSVPPKDVPAFVEKSFREPNSDFWMMLGFTALKERLGPKDADKLLVDVCLEAARAYPMETAWLFLDKGVQTYFDPLMLAVPTHGPFPEGSFQPPLSKQIAAAGDFTNPTSFDRAVDDNLRWLMRSAIVLAIVTLPVALFYRTWQVTIALLIFGLYLNFAVVVGNTALFRYVIYAIPVNLLCAYVGVVALVSTLWVRYQRKPL